jgi:hypothetical protein
MGSLCEGKKGGGKVVEVGTTTMQERPAGGQERPAGMVVCNTRSPEIDLKT